MFLTLQLLTYKIVQQMAEFVICGANSYSLRHLDLNKKGVGCEKRTLRRSRTGLELQSQYMQRCQNWGPRCATYPLNVINEY